MHRSETPGPGVAPPAEGSPGWVSALRGPTGVRAEATADLRVVLMRGARFGISRSRPGLEPLAADEVDALAIQAADRALSIVLSRLDDFRGRSRFTTWASKYVLREVRVALREREAGST